ncbi:kelch-like protein 13 [Mytilus trossulus]|uniref:kelch-like protein 13 n=1 Tax=Mytilus trossulus TaxID=6551 RepID=UPI00300507D8
MSSIKARSSIDDSNFGIKSFEFVFMFNKSTGSPKVFYLMVDPIGKCRLFPKTNTVLFPKLKNLVNFRAVVLDDCLYIIGGKDWETGEHIDKTWRYDPANSRWIQRANLINARCRHTATVLNGCIYITGGEVIGGRVTESCECYDPVKDKWTEILDLPRPRADHAACANGLNLYASGGISNLKHQCSNVFWTYDPITNEWTEPLPGVILPHEREKHNMISVGKRVVVIGGRGFDQETFSEKDEGAVCSYNTHTKGNARKDGIWDIFHPNVFNPRGNAGVVLLGRNLYLMGGKSYQKDCDVRMVECYNTKRRKIRESFQLPDSFSYVNVDCVVLKVPITNTDINFDDILLYDKYIMW